MRGTSINSRLLAENGGLGVNSIRGCNALGVPIAAGVLYPLMNLLLNPMIAGAAMVHHAGQLEGMWNN